MPNKKYKAFTYSAAVTLLASVGTGALLLASNPVIHADSNAQSSQVSGDDSQTMGPVDPGKTNNQVTIHFVDGSQNVADMTSDKPASDGSTMVPDGYSIAGKATIKRQDDGSTVVKVPVKKDKSQQVTVQFVDDKDDSVVSEVGKDNASPKTDDYHTTGSVNVKGSEKNQTITIGVLKDGQTSDSSVADNNSSTDVNDDSDKTDNTSSSVDNERTDDSSSSSSNSDENFGSQTVDAKNDSSDSASTQPSDSKTDDHSSSSSNSSSSDSSNPGNESSDQYDTPNSYTGATPVDYQDGSTPNSNSESDPNVQSSSSSDQQPGQNQNTQQLPQTGSHKLSQILGGLVASIGSLFSGLFKF